MQQAMQSTIGSLREMLFLLPHEAWASKRVGLLGARFASRVTAHPLTKFFLAPTLRRGEMWLFGLLFGARCTMELAQKFRGATLSKWHRPNSCFPWPFHLLRLLTLDIINFGNTCLSHVT